MEMPISSINYLVENRIETLKERQRQEERMLNKKQAEPKIAKYHSKK